MNQKNTECPTEFLPTFLNNGLTKQQTESIEDHLSSCERCRAELQNESGGAAFWSTVSELSDDQFDCDWISLSEDADADDSDDATARHESRLRTIFETIKPLLSPSDDPKSAGKIGNYEVLGIVGSGGMGVVMKAEDPSLGRVVAIKLLAPHLAAFESSRKRFRREAKAAAAIHYHGIIPIHNVDEHQGVPYFVMPYEAGPSLQQRIERDGKLTVEETLCVAVQIASALRAAHQTELVHRDIKPSNILLAPGTERALLTDFGLAQVCDQQNITQTGMVAGTPMFMSPEQARGESVDARSDLFSLGSVIFMMLTGQPPLTAESSYAIVRKIGGEQMPRLRSSDPSLPVWLERLVERLHAIDPNHRVQSAEEVEALMSQSLSHLRNPSEQSLPDSLRPASLGGLLIGKSGASIGGKAIALALLIACVGWPMWNVLKPTETPPSQINSLPVEQTLNQADESPVGMQGVFESRASIHEQTDSSVTEDWNDELDSVINEVRERIEAIEAELAEDF